MHMQILGHGPALVLLHGWALNSAAFGPLIAPLAARFRLYLVDLPGHGRSRDDRLPLALEPVVATLTAIVPPALWLGWSLGGLFALHAAATRPGQVRGLAMIASSPRFVRAPDWPDAIAPALLHRFAEDLASDYSGTIDRFVALDLIDRHAPSAGEDRGRPSPLRQAILARGEPSPAALDQGLALLETSDLRAYLPRIGQPALWLAGQRDRLVPLAAMQTAAAAMADARALVLPGTGHAPFLAEPEQVTTLIGSLQQRVRD